MTLRSWSVNPGRRDHTPVLGVLLSHIGNFETIGPEEHVNSENARPMLEAALAASSAASASLMAEFQRMRTGDSDLKAWNKSPGALVTEADIAADRAIAASLTSQGDGSQIISEESTSDGDGAGVWLVDPLCGTVPFRSGMPHWGVNIAYRTDAELVAGVIAVPALDETLAAAAGEGATLNGKPVAGRDPGLPADEAIVGLEIDGMDEWRRLLTTDNRGETQVSWAGRVGHTNTFCSAAYPLYLVCTGGVSGVVFYRIDPVHLAAGAMIAGELGAVVSDGDGNPINWRSNDTIEIAVVAWPSIHPHLMNALRH